MKQTPRIWAALFLIAAFCPAPALAQDGAPADPSVAFAPVTAIPIPQQCTSGRFSSLDPPNRVGCPQYSKVVGRVVSRRLILVNGMECRGLDGESLVNVELSDPADAVQMVTGRRVAITATFTSALEHRGSFYRPVYLIAEKAELVAGDPIDRSAPAFTSYMICQPPELDTLAAQLGSDLCVQSTVVANLAVLGPALDTAARAPEKTSPEDAASGESNAISCHPDVVRSDKQLSALACAHNNYWVWWKRKWRDSRSQGPAPP